MGNQYDSMTLVNLRELAKEKGLKNITALKKSDLIESLIRMDSEAASNESIKVETNPSVSRPSAQKQLVPKQTESRQPEQRQVVQRQVAQRQTEQRQLEQRQLEPRQFEPRQLDQRQVDQRQFEAKFDMKSVDFKPSDGRMVDIKTAEMNQTEIKSDQIQSDFISSKDEKKSMTSQHNEMEQLDSGETKVGILEVLPDGYGFIRCDNYLPGENDVYVSPAQIRRFNLKTGDIVSGNTRIKNQNEKFSALLYIKSVNGFHPNEAQKRKRFEDLTPIFPNNRVHLETPGSGVSMRMVDLISPIGKGQRGMIVSQPKAGKTTLLKQIAKAVTRNHPDMKLIILLIDERPEEVTDIKESIEGKNVEVIYSTFDELPDNHKRVSEMVIERAKRLVEHKQDVIILLDSITRLARAYNLTVQPSGRTLSGGLDPAALHMPKKFFGAARNMREGGSLTILATALVETGSRMDDVVFEEFKGTGNMELVLDRSLSEKRIFPAIDLQRSSTRRDDLLLTQPEMEATYLMRKALSGMKSDDALERIIDMFFRTKTNNEFIEIIKKTKIVG